VRICFIAHQGTKEGAGRFLLDEIDYLLGKKISVFVILPEAGPLAEALAQRGVTFEIVPNPWWTKPKHIGQELDHEATLDSARQMAALLRAWSVDLVYTQTVVAPAGPLAAVFAEKPHIWHIHEFSFNPDCIDMAIPQAALARLIDQTSNLVIFNSQAVAAEWGKWLPASKTKIVRNWIAPGVATPAQSNLAGLAVELEIRSNQFVIAIAGSILPWKRQMDAVKALANLVKERLDVVLLIIGPTLDANYFKAIKEFVHKRRLQDRVRFLGYREDTASVMKLAKVTLVCSMLEPFGRVTVESMACGIPVIGAKSGGTVEIIEDEINGLLFTPGNIGDLTTQLRRLMEDETVRRALGRNALKRAEKFSSADREMAPLLEQLQSLVGAKNPSGPLPEFFASTFPPSLAVRKKATMRTGGKQLARKIYHRIKRLAA